jgi:hypothetical protein
VNLKLRPPNRMVTTWYRRINDEPPTACTFDPLGDIARLAPYRFRRFHQIVAAIGGYFWLPCVLCERPFGGHEAGKVIPDPTRGPGLGMSICSECSRSRP